MMTNNNTLIIGNFSGHISGKACFEGSNINYNKDLYYWISIGVFGLDKSYFGNYLNIIVSHGTEEYDKLTELVKNKDNKLIETYANQIIIKHADPEYIYMMIEKIKSEKYKQGRNDVQAELRKALGIEISEYGYLTPVYNERR